MTDRDFQKLGLRKASRSSDVETSGERGRRRATYVSPWANDAKSNRNNPRRKHNAPGQNDGSNE